MPVPSRLASPASSARSAPSIIRSTPAAGVVAANDAAAEGSVAEAQLAQSKGRVSPTRCMSGRPKHLSGHLKNHVKTMDEPAPSMEIADMLSIFLAGAAVF